MLPHGDRKWQLIYPNGNFKILKNRDCSKNEFSSALNNKTSFNNLFQCPELNSVKPAATSILGSQ
jgi:hypothetical protein